MISIAFYESPIGKIVIKADNNSLCGLWFEGQKYFPPELLNASAVNADAEVIVSTCLWLDSYFSGLNPDPAVLPLAPCGSEFRRKVWGILCRIPYGNSMTYGQIAKDLEAAYGGRVSAQAVGGAVGHNPISIIIPCHRVLGSDGSLVGYAGGNDRKTFLLSLEGTIKK